MFSIEDVSGDTTGDDGRTYSERARVDFTKLFLPSEIVDGSKKFTVQFHQQLKLQISILNWHTFCQICLPFVKHCSPVKGSQSVCAKKAVRVC